VFLFNGYNFHRKRQLSWLEIKRHNSSGFFSYKSAISVNVTESIPGTKPLISNRTLQLFRILRNKNGWKTTSIESNVTMDSSFGSWLNWWKGKPSGSIACTRKQQPRFYWSCSSVVMNDATPLTPLAHERNSIFKCKQNTCTLHDPWGPEKYDYTMM